MTLGREVDESMSHALLPACLDAGINLFDCANIYGLGKAEIPRLAPPFLYALVVGYGRDELVVQTRRLLPGRPASRLFRFARNDSVSACHCEEYSDEAISFKVRTGGNHLSGLHH
jgi:aryl-alcohol dehydrogenase-like predicted oxidoreductase